MAKVVSNRHFFFIKVVLLLCEHGSLNKIENGAFLTPPNSIRVSLDYSYELFRGGHPVPGL